MSRHREAFEKFAERAEEELGDSLHKLVLYGSVARGDENKDSDVDVFAVVEDEDEKDRLYSIASEVSLEFDVHIAAIVRTVEDFGKTRDTFFTREVIDSGEAVI